MDGYYISFFKLMKNVIVKGNFLSCHAGVTISVPNQNTSNSWIFQSFFFFFFFNSKAYLNPTLFSLWNPVRWEAGVVIGCTPVVSLIQIWTILSFTAASHIFGGHKNYECNISRKSNSEEPRISDTYLKLICVWWKAIKRNSKQKSQLIFGESPSTLVSWKYALVALIKQLTVNICNLTLKSK